MRRALSSSLAGLLLLLSPGPAAWGQVAAVRTAPIPVGTPGLGAFGAGLKSPSLSPTLGTPSLLLPSAPTLPSAAAPTLALPSAIPAAAAPAALAEASKPLAKAMARTAAAARPFIEAAREPGGGASGAHAAGRGLEAALTGLRSAPDSAVAVAPKEERNGILPGGSAGLLHDHDHGTGQRPQAAEPAAPAAPVPPSARRAFGFYAAGVSAVKVGIETLNLVVPILLLTHYGAATVLGALFISAQVAGLAAGAVAGPLIDRFGAKKALAAAAALQMATIGVVPVSLVLGAPVSLPVLFGLFALNGALSGVFDIARRAALPTILGTDEGTLRRYNAKLYIAREIAAMGAVFGAGWLLGKVGALATLTLHPAAYLAAAAAFVLLARMRSDFRAAPASARPEAGTSRWREFTEGARLVTRDPALRLAALVNVPVIALHNLFHAMLAAVYATSVLGSPALAAVMIGAWNAGELAAAFYLDRRGEESGGSAWLRYAALMGLSAWALFAFPTIWVAAPVAFLLATSTLGNEIGLASYFQSAAPKGREGAVTGFVYSAATAVAMALMLGAGWMFDTFGALPGFGVLAAVLTGVSVLYLLASRRLKR